MLQNTKKQRKKGMNLSSALLKIRKGQKMFNKNRRNTIIKANAPIVKLMNLIWGL
jgi:hypothetical protein